MNKKQLSTKVASRVKLKKNQVEEVLDVLLDHIQEALARGDKVRLVGFGNFVVRTRAPRMGRNPQTGDRISIPSTKTPAFVPGIHLKDYVKEKHEQSNK